MTEPHEYQAHNILSEEEAKAIGDAILDAMVPLEKQFGLNKTVLGILYVAGFACGAGGSVLDMRGSVSAELPSFKVGYRTGVAVALRIE